MMEAVCTSVTLVSLNVTIWCYIPEDSKLQLKGCYFKDAVEVEVALKSAFQEVACLMA
jgi:hypothetical protein